MLLSNSIYQCRDTDNLHYRSMRTNSITAAIICIADDVETDFIFSAPERENDDITVDIVELRKLIDKYTDEDGDLDAAQLRNHLYSRT